jgi:hypothetical protein
MVTPEQPSPSVQPAVRRRAVDGRTSCRRRPDPPGSQSRPLCLQLLLRKHLHRVRREEPGANVKTLLFVIDAAAVTLSIAAFSIITLGMGIDI